MGIVSSEIFAQIGTSLYEPVNFPWTRFLSSEEFTFELNRADIVISHGASGSIMGALNAGKKVIAVTRLAEYGEHINNHQIGICRSLAEEKLVLAVFDMSKLGEAILQMENGTADIIPWKNPHPGLIIKMIDEFIEESFR